MCTCFQRLAYFRKSPKRELRQLITSLQASLTKYLDAHEKAEAQNKLSGVHEAEFVMAMNVWQAFDEACAAAGDMQLPNKLVPRVVNAARRMAEQLPGFICMCFFLFFVFSYCFPCEICLDFCCFCCVLIRFVCV